jgi:CBS domain-containing protein
MLRDKNLLLIKKISKKQITFQAEGESMRARDIMDTRFHVLHPGDGIAAAVKKFKSASIEEGKKVFGMMVVDNEKIVGIVYVSDVFYHILNRFLD